MRTPARVRHPMRTAGWCPLNMRWRPPGPDGLAGCEHVRQRHSGVQCVGTDDIQMISRAQDASLEEPVEGAHQQEGGDSGIIPAPKELHKFLLVSSVACSTVYSPVSL